MRYFQHASFSWIMKAQCPSLSPQGSDIDTTAFRKVSTAGLDSNRGIRRGRLR
jgi:hypothetical protein